MSYFDSLSSWQNAGNSIQAQQQANEQENRNQKAEGIEDKFAYIDKVMGEVGGGVGGFGGGFHIARKVYKKAKSLQAKAKEAKEAIDKARGQGKPAEPDSEGSKPPAEHTDKPNGQEDSPSEPSSAGDGRKPPEQPEANEQDAKSANDEPDTSTKEEEPKADETEPKAEAPEETQAEAPQAPEPSVGNSADDALRQEHSIADSEISRNQEIVDGAERGTGYTPADGELAQMKIDAHNQFKQDNPLPEDKPTLNTGEAQEGESSIGRQSSDARATSSNAEPKSVAEKPSLETIEEPKFGESETSEGGLGQAEDGTMRVGTNPTPEDQLPVRGEAPSAEAPELNTSGADEVSNTISDLKGQASDFADRVGGLANKAKNLVSNTSDLADGGTQALKDGVESAGKKVAGKVAEDGMAEAGGVLDFLGPVGEILGAGLALGSFFHDLIEHHREKKQAEEAQNATGNIAQNTGISMASIQSAGNKSNVVGTLV